MFINDKSNNQNNEVQIFIIKQVKREKKTAFESRYSRFLGKNKTFLSIGKDFSNFFRPLMVAEERRTSYLVPLIYDEKAGYNNFEFEQLLFQQGESPDLYTYTEENGTIKSEYVGDKIFWNTTYDSIKKCPLLDFTKLAYVFQTIQNNNLGISSVTGFNVNLSVNNPSNASITLENFGYKYNLSPYDNLTNQNDVYKSIFDTDDIVILRIAKRSNRDYQAQKFKDPYANDENDYFQTVFTGLINNVNESINWNSKTQTITLQCQGASKLISYSRVITGQATCDMDSTTAIVPISCFSYPQTQSGPEAKYTLDNREIVKNLIVRTLTSIDNIPDCYTAKNAFERKFEQLYNSEQNNNILGKEVQEERTKYNNSVSANFKDYVKDGDGQYTIYRNAYKTKESDGYLPIFIVKGTNQPPYQYSFNNFQQMFVANYETVYQFIKKIADNLQFTFYDDQYGIIHFELIDTDMQHLYDTNDPNFLTQVISYSKEQDTNSVANVMPIYGQSVWANCLPGQQLGIGAIVRDATLIEKYGERPMSPRNVTGLHQKKGCEKYGRELLDRMNRRIESYSLSIVGEPSLKLGKYAYFQEYRKLFYVDSITHQYSAGSSLNTSLNGTYERYIISDVLNAVNNPYKSFGFTEDKKIDQAMLENDPQKSRAELNQMKFNYLRGLINNKLEKINADNYIETLKEIFKKVEQEEVGKKLVEILKESYGYKYASNATIDYLNSLYVTKDQEKNPIIPFLYLDGYFWQHNFESDLYKQAHELEEQELERLKMEAKDKEKRKTKSGRKMNNAQKTTQNLNSVKLVEQLDSPLKG